jgi:hypothetical protein
VMEIRYKGKTLFTRKPKASAGRITG